MTEASSIMCPFFRPEGEELSFVSNIDNPDGEISLLGPEIDLDVDGHGLCLNNDSQSRQLCCGVTFYEMLALAEQPNNEVSKHMIQGYSKAQELGEDYLQGVASGWKKFFRVKRNSRSEERKSLLQAEIGEPKDLWGDC